MKHPSRKHAGVAGRPPRRDRPTSGREPEPILIPPEWRYSPERARRKRILKRVGKVGLALLAFGVLTSPFIYNQLEYGRFYYQEVPVEPLPPVAPAEEPMVVTPPAPAEAIGDEPSAPEAVPSPEQSAPPPALSPPSATVPPSATLPSD